MHIIHETQNIVAIATCKSANRKTGKSVQIWILSKNMHPHDSRTTGEDAKNQCKGCDFASYNGCYVITPTLAALWRSYQDGKYTYLNVGTKAWDKFFRGEYVRLGAYGNPSKLPLSMVESICGLARRHTGYFHDWHLMSAKQAKGYGRFFMASTSATNQARAKALGLRTFTTGGGEIEKGLQCPAYTHDMQCGECGLCDGTFRRDTLPDVWINPHGYQTKKAQAC